MDNETTKILNPQQKPESKLEQKTTTNTEKKEDVVSQAKKSKASNFGERVAATAAGAAIGTSTVMAAAHIYNASAEEPAQEDEQTQDTPTEQEAIVMTDEGLQVAQVDDSLSFSEAFKEARAQVGAGGVFEWHGKVYGTFYENEWNNMSATEKAEWQAKVDYSDVTEPEDVQPISTHQYAAAHAVPANHDTQTEEAVPEDGTYIDPATSDPEDNEVHVVGVAIQDNGQGGITTIASIQAGDDMAVVVDVDSDGRLDYLIHDGDGNEQISEGEVHDISSENIATAEVIDVYVEETHAHGAQAVVTELGSGEHYQITETEEGFELESIDGSSVDNDMYSASNDDMPDYMNNADTGMMDA